MEIEPFRLIISDRSQKIILDYASPTFRSKYTLNVGDIFSLSEPNQENEPDLVFSLEMGDCYVDMASAAGIFCLSAVPTSLPPELRKMNGLLSVSVLYTMMDYMSHYGSAIPDASIVNLPQQPFSVLLKICLQFLVECPTNRVEFAAFISGSGNHLFTVGETSLDDDSDLFQEGINLIDDMEDELFAVSGAIPRVASFSLSKNVNFFALFAKPVSEEDVSKVFAIASSQRFVLSSVFEDKSAASNADAESSQGNPETSEGKGCA